MSRSSSARALHYTACGVVSRSLSIARTSLQISDKVYISTCSSLVQTDPSPCPFYTDLVNSTCLPAAGCADRSRVSPAAFTYPWSRRLGRISCSCPRPWKLNSSLNTIKLTPNRGSNRVSQRHAGDGGRHLDDCRELSHSHAREYSSLFIVDSITIHNYPAEPLCPSRAINLNPPNSFPCVFLNLAQSRDSIKAGSDSII